MAVSNVEDGLVKRMLVALAAEPAEAMDAPKLDMGTYVPRGTTALYDAVGRTIDDVGKRLGQSAGKPDGVVVAILTDGHENASKDYRHAKVAERIKHQREKYNWEFVFLGANMDAEVVADTLNIRHSASFTTDSEGFGVAYSRIGDTVSTYRNWHR
jgi:hypothetical protein